MKPDEKEAENIRVAVRCRPMNERENREQSVSCFTCGPNGSAVLTNMDNPTEKHEFGFDFVYGCDSKQETVFQDIGLPLLDRAFAGYNGTIFAYGQTGSGKSFSMTGVTGGPEAMEGLIPRVNRAIFERVATERVDSPNKRFLVECSFFEIYNEIIYDLLDSSGNGKKNKGGLEIKEHSVLGIYVKDLQERVVETREEIVELMALGAQSRTVGYTQMNAESSRSHSIFTIKIHQKDADDETKSVFAKINLVDLAGSERAASTGAQGDRLREGANINKSLSALGNVINALVEASRAGKKVFIPYRNSKLTRVLQESLGGNSLCSMLATLSPASINFAETLSTLKYASRAKSIKVNAKKNEASSQITQLNEEIATLKQKLQEQMEATLGLDPKEKDEIVKKYEKQIQEMDRVRLQTWEDKAKLSKQHEMERKKLARERALADQRIREERTKKWRLLEEKGDLELIMRALRDLDSNNSATTDAVAASTAVQWLETAQKVKTMEGEAKDLRTLIQVFRDSLHKDVELWARRCGLSQDTSNAKSTKNLLRREDSATASAAHMTASQMSSKLQNISDESEKLLALEGQLVSDRSALINTMTRELLRLKARHAQLKAEQAAATAALAGKPNPNAALAAKEEEQLLEERERGLTITLALVRTQRTTLVQAINSDRQRIFEFATVTKHFVSFADQHILLSQGSATKTPQVTQQLARWEDAKTKLLAVSKAWEDIWNSKSSENDVNATEYVGDGEVSALGLESRLLPDECFSASSRTQEAKFARLNGAQCWVPNAHDTTPSLVIDFELPRIFDSISIRGGKILPNTGSLTESAPTATSNGTAAASPPASSFVLANTADLQKARARYKLDQVTGSNELAYELLAHVMSWQDLLKTDVIPVKLFARPPVLRFLHDVISAVMSNTGFAMDVVSPAQRDYAQLTTKTERGEYLSAVLDYVQAWYQRQLRNVENSPPVIIAATASNILAGKEPTDTVQFLGFLALAAMDHAVQNPPPPVAAIKEQTLVADSAPVAEAKTSPEATTDIPQDGWVTRLRVATSFTANAGDWRILGEFDANTDAEGEVSIDVAVGEVKADGSRAGRFLQLTCIKWQQRAALQVEVFGREAHESSSMAQNIEALASKARALLEKLRHTAMLVVEEARALYDRAKVAESEKHAQLASYGEEVAKLRAASAAWEKKEREMQEQQAHLTAQIETANQRADREKSRGDTLQSELTQASSQGEEFKRRGDNLQTKLGEKEHQIQTLSMQVGEQKRNNEALQQTKQQLEELATNLRSQLTDNKHEKDASQQEGQSRLAELNGELMSVRVQLDEQRRALEVAELHSKEQEAFGHQQHNLLQEARAALIEKETEADAKLKTRISESEAAIRALHDERDTVKQELERALAAENLLKLAASKLEAQCAATGSELDSWRRRAETAETEIQAQTQTNNAAGSESNGRSDNAESEVTTRENETLLLEAQTKELRRLAELEKMEAKVQSLEQELVASEGRAYQAEQALLESAKRVKELEETEEELQLQLQVVTDERDSARQKEEQLFAETYEKDQEIERIRDGYVWVTDRMNSKEDELSELQEQLERYQSLLEVTGAKSVDLTPATKPKEDKLGAEIAKLYVLAVGTKDMTAGSEAMIAKLAEWIEAMKMPTKSPLTEAQPKQQSPPQQSSRSVKDPDVKDVDVKLPPSNTTDAKNAEAAKVNGEEEADYDDDFDDADDKEEVNKSRRK
ncbi:Kinesin [Phytophthora megakarya]|uniref:Kinesin n=1 Tax=Phytophthora megakarya TaxID=4795 RepID=A0A225X0T5_9STRA|nr:Kinesin [Phytophthora megakarya]